MAIKKKVIDPEVKEGIAEIVKAVDGLIDSEFPASLAALMFKMKEELTAAGFTDEEAFQIVLAHGVQPPNK